MKSCAPFVVAVSQQWTEPSLVERLRLRRSEIEEAIIARIRALADDPRESQDVRYQESQRATVVALLDYVLLGIERGEDGAGPVPFEAVAQARQAARRGVGLGTIWRRYSAAHAELEGFVVQDRVGQMGDVAALRRVQAIQASLLDRVIVSVSDGYESELRSACRSAGGPAGVTGDGVRSLTPSERAVVALIGQGQKNAEIALTRGVQLETVRAQCKKIYRKLGVTSRGQLLGLEIEPLGSVRQVR